ncbi:MAG: nicotinate-nucleotide adenylyltransferase [Lachnospiraceae bacterium]|nr:nicotinate-nucleotide adenylyltransferase [Lachnospiraceae bacterium]
MKTGILGGTFNPIHNAHLSLGKAAKEQFKLDKLVFMPAARPAYKDPRQLVSFEDRMEMTRLAVEEVLGGEKNGYFLSDLEFKRPGNTYTCDTLAYLTKEEPDTEFYFIIGGDSLMWIDEWKDPANIVNKCTLLVAERGETRLRILKEKAESLKKTINARIEFIDYPCNFVSSSDIRRKIKSGDAKPTDLPSSVIDYIDKKELYGCCKDGKYFTADEIQAFTKDMEATLSTFRFQHSLGVAYTSAALAMVYGVAVDKATAAGLLHDSAKEIPHDEQERLCDQKGICLTDTERRLKQLIHGKLAAGLLQEKYGIKDEDFLNSIRNHVVGRPAMSRLEQIVFCADFLEPQRDFVMDPPLKDIRSLVFRDIDKATAMILKATIEFLREKGKEIDTSMETTFDYYKVFLDNEETVNP